MKVSGVSQENSYSADKTQFKMPPLQTENNGYLWGLQSPSAPRSTLHHQVRVVGGEQPHYPDGQPKAREPLSAPGLSGLLPCLALHPQPWCPSPFMC